MKCCVYISGEPLSQKRPHARVALLRIRVDPQFLAEGTGLTVFSATLSSATRHLTIDDTLIWKGRYVIDDEIFSKRWGLAVQWIEHYCLLDPRLLGGIEIEMAKWSPLEKLKPEKSWELQPDEAGRKRYLWIAKYAETPSPPTDISDAPAAIAPTLDTGPLVAVATRDVGPEQWILTAGDGTSLGRALIRTLAISAPLRSLKSSTARVEVEWNPIFAKWEVKALSESLATVSGAKFAAAK